MTMEVVKREKKVEEEYTIKPESSTPALDTSTWPLLLKNYEKRKHDDVAGPNITSAQLAHCSFFS